MLIKVYELGLNTRIHYQFPSRSEGHQANSCKSAGVPEFGTSGLLKLPWRPYQSAMGTLHVFKMLTYLIITLQLIKHKTASLFRRKIAFLFCWEVKRDHFITGFFFSLQQNFYGNLTCHKLLSTSYWKWHSTKSAVWVLRGKDICVRTTLMSINEIYRNAPYFFEACDAWQLCRSTCVKDTLYLEDTFHHVLLND